MLYLSNGIIAPFADPLSEHLNTSTLVQRLVDVRSAARLSSKVSHSAHHVLFTLYVWQLLAV